MLTLQERDAIIARVNPLDKFINADDKIVTAGLAAAAGVPHVPILAVIETPDGIDAAVDFVSQQAACVIKPARGSGGSGILILNGRKITAHDIRTHLGNILGGLYSMRAQPDRALVQRYVRPHPFFTALHGLGVADIRVIVYDGVPVMAMLRLPTRESGGKANVHAGAIGVGIDMATGTTTTAIYRGKIIARHPDSDRLLANHALPFWPAIRSLAAATGRFSGLGYAGVDIVIDAQNAPLLLEVNARPGLAIQAANQASLKPLLI